MPPKAIADFMENLLNLITPNKANAEVVPQDPYMQVLWDKLKVDPRYSPIATAAQNRPEKVGVTYYPELLKQGQLGSYHPGGKNPVIAIGVPATGKIPGHEGDSRYKQNADPIAVFAHELTHFLYNKSPYPREKKLLPHMNEAMADNVETYGAANRGSHGYPDLLDAILSVQSGR